METIKKSTFEFLNILKDNNNREWFIKNRPLYTDARDNIESFVQAIINKIIDFEPIMKGLEAKSCFYRINRDIRFSNDKSPYKTHFGAFIVRGGKKNGDKFAGYYIHIEPGKSLIAGGAYMPPTPWLSAIREIINEEPVKLVKIINTKDFIKYFGKIEGEKLKKAPKGYHTDHPNIDLLRFKSYLVENEVNDEFVLSEKYFDHVLNVIKAMKPFNDFLNNY
ncbi:MAG: DUF2461 domain-containing protein [Bacteroidales bacterium]|nr:DUF2461 domain-containing protein [Bacteroidales bacterium]MDP3001519.1 DUF2461 domain-containing protein [Bacteroidales bacterium]